MIHAPSLKVAESLAEPPQIDLAAIFPTRAIEASRLKFQMPLVSSYTKRQAMTATPRRSKHSQDNTTFRQPPERSNQQPNLNLHARRAYKPMPDTAFSFWVVRRRAKSKTRRR